MGLVLRAVDVAGSCRWRWELVDGRSGVLLAEHQVHLDPEAVETAAFEDLYRFLRRRTDPRHPVTSDTDLVRRVGAWIGSQVLGERLGRAIATAAPVTVRVVLPAGAEFLAARPLELAHVDGAPLAAWGHVALVYEFAGLPRTVKPPVGDALRMLAVFSLPPAALADELRRERRELSGLMSRVAARGRRQVQLDIAQYRVTRTVLADLAEDGWDVLHLSGIGRTGGFLLQNSDGSPDPLTTSELIELLRPARRRLKLAVLSPGQSAAAATADTLRRLGLDGPAGDLEARAVRDAGGTPVSVAREVVTQLGCAVVAMRYPVGHQFAAAFAEALYTRVLRNTQLLDRAVAAAIPDAAGPVPSSACPAISVATPAIFGASAVALSLAPPVANPVPGPADASMSSFPPEPARFVGRTEAMAAASTALAQTSGRTAVLFQGIAGTGKTTCAVELAYRHQRAFHAAAFWSAPAEPDRFGEALRLLAVALEAQLGQCGVTMVDRIATSERLANFLPTLTAVLADTDLLLVLDNLDTLLTPDGQWRDRRWAALISALTCHDGPSRVIMTSRVAPAGLNSDSVLVQPVHALSRDESALLIRELPNLQAVLDNPPAGPGGPDPELGRRVLTLAQGHPLLLELADAAAADPARLAFQLTEVEAAVTGATGEGATGEGVDETVLATLLTEGHTRLDTEQLQGVFTTWITQVAATLPAPARLLLQALCRIEQTDRSTAALGVNWTALWRRLDQDGAAPPLASWVDPLVSAALITTEPMAGPAEPEGPVRYHVHPAVAEAVHAATPEPVTAEVDAQLAAWWTVVGQWGTEQERVGRDSGHLVLRAGQAAARYLLRRQDWNAACCLLESVLIRDSYSAVTSMAVLPLLRRIAEATEALDHLVVLGSALRKVDPGEAETLLRRAYDQATADGEYRLASTTAGDLITLLRDQGRLQEALTLTQQKIEHTGRAGFGCWTQLSDQGRRLQILSLLGRHEQVLGTLPALRARMAELPDQRGDNERVNPGNVREGILDLGRSSALASARWTEALEFNDELVRSKQCRGVSASDAARSRFFDHVPLRRLGRLSELDRLLQHCQEVFESAGDSAHLAAVHAARADLADRRGRPRDAVELQRSALRLRYLRPDPAEIAPAHDELATYLAHACAEPAEQRAHRLTAALLNYLTGDTQALTRAVGVLAAELRADPGDPDQPLLPSTLTRITRLVDAGDGFGFGKLVGTLSPESGTAERALADLLGSAANCAE